MNICPQSPQGRLLLALRAGPLDAAALRERFGSAPLPLGSMQRQGLIARLKVDLGWGGYQYRLTAAGRAACPLRNPILAAAQKSPTQKEKGKKP